MQIIEPHVEILTPREHLRRYPELIEHYGAVAYQGVHTVESGSAAGFIRRFIIDGGHESILEHFEATAQFTCDRSASHQLVRHRIAAYTQESQRVMNYQDGIEVICPPSVRQDETRLAAWRRSVAQAETSYRELIQMGVAPEDARSVLPNCMKTTVVATYNLRQWRHVFLRRALNPRAQWQIRDMMLTLLKQFYELLPEVFGDLESEILYGIVFGKSGQRQPEG